MVKNVVILKGLYRYLKVCKWGKVDIHRGLYGQGKSGGKVSLYIDFHEESLGKFMLFAKNSV